MPTHTAAFVRAVVPALLAASVVALGGCQRQRSTPDARVTAPEPAVLARADTDLPHVSVELLELTRVSEGTVELRFTLTAAPAAPGAIGIADVLSGDLVDRGGIADVYLIDAASQKKYFVVRDMDHQAVSSRNLDPLRPGESRRLWVRLAAPPAGVDEVEVQIPRAPIFTGVRIGTRAVPGKRASRSR